MPRRAALALCALWTATVGAFMLPHAPATRRTKLCGAGMSDTDNLIYELASMEVFSLPAKVRQEAVLRAVGRPQFFLRIAELCDDAPAEEREKLAALADNLASTLSVIVESAEEKMDDASEVLQGVVAACAEEDGEFLVPLAPERFAALRDAVNARVEEGVLGEGVLSTVDAWAKKAQDDGLDGMVTILRKVLQLYAARVLRFDAAEAAAQLAQMMPPDAAEKVDTSGDVPALHPDYQAAAELYGAVLDADADEWPERLAVAFNGDSPVMKRHVLAIVQAQIERVVLLQENGSFQQRVQAEFLRELVQQVEKHAPKSADDAFDPVQAVLEMDD
mmetsp:Transcript_6025/g.17783  ORF Transcript_6025/g.17783 Transcript_6025/m.17783 type:complete len:333 (+) Transcript_6025:192-1190(+)